MSLAALAIRTCTVLALRGRTIAENRIEDSAIGPLDAFAGGPPVPFITVAIDAAEGRPKGGRALLSCTDSLYLVIEAGIASMVQAPGRTGAGADVAIDIPESSSGLANALDLLGWRIKQLMTGPEAAPWAELWRRFVFKVNSAIWVRSSSDDGVRIALRQWQLDVEPISEPDIGRPPAGVWADFIAALRAIDASEDPELAAYHGLANLLDAVLRAPADLADWQVIAARLGATIPATEAIGITPAALVMADGNPELFAAATIAGDPWPEAGETLDEDRGDEIAPESWAEDDAAPGGSGAAM